MTGLGSLAKYGGKPAQEPRLQIESSEMIVEEGDGGQTANARKAGFARESIAGGMAALKDELKGTAVFKEALWRAIVYVFFVFFPLPCLRLETG